MTGWSTSSKKPRAASWGRSGWSWGCITLPTGTPASHSTVDDLVRRPGAAPLPQVLVDPVVPARPGRPWSPARGRPPTPDRPVRRASAAHCSSVATAIGHPPVVAPVLVGTGDLVEVLRRRRGPTVPGPFEQRAIGRELNRLLGRDVEGGIDHGRLHQAPFTGALPVLEREQQAVQGVEPRVGITDAIGLERGAGPDAR